MGLRSALLVVVAGLALAGCGSGEDSAEPAPSPGATSSGSPSGSASGPAIPTPAVEDGRIEATDGSFTLAVPKGWTSAERGVPEPFVVALQDGDRASDQFVVSAYPDDENGAEETATNSAAGLRGQKATCEPAAFAGLDGIDCAYDYQGRSIHKVFLPVVKDGSSVLVLLQTEAPTRAAAADLLAPFLAGWQWDDGSALSAG